MLTCCIDPYRPGEVTGNANFLVVDAFLDATANVCTVKLSRTIPLASTEMVFEQGAVVTLEDENALSFFLSEVNAGEYSTSGLAINPARKYKIKIRTQNDEEYQSELVPVLQTPAIDSVTWNGTEEGVGIYVNTHDPANNTRYYHWKFTETWHYRAKYYSVLKIVGDTTAARDETDPPIYHCWNTDISKEILTGSSDKLGEDIISNFSLSTIPWKSAKLMLKYSVLVEQQAIEPEAYDYWQQLKKNTEELGTIFDPLPSTTIGNLRCVSDPGKIVLGYFNASTVAKKRIFISTNDIDFPQGNLFETGYENCYTVVVLFGEEFEGNLQPITYESEGIFTIGYRAGYPYCIDCRLQGGTNVKPVFWED